MEKIKMLTEEELNNVSDEVMERISDACKKASLTTMLKAKRYSIHPDDKDLYTVLGVRKYTIADEVTKEYVTWMYNDSTKSLNWGHYFGDYPQRAEKDYKDRVYIPS